MDTPEKVGLSLSSKRLDYVKEACKVLIVVWAFHLPSS